MLKGVFSYIAILGFTLIWVLGWLCICWLVGAFFDLPMGTTAIVGATLGPLGLVAVLILGALNQRGGLSMPREKRQISAEVNGGDPFA
jgi:hypothetical protein